MSLKYLFFVLAKGNCKLNYPWKSRFYQNHIVFIEHVILASVLVSLTWNLEISVAQYEKSYNRTNVFFVSPDSYMLFQPEEAGKFLCKN